MKPQGDSIRIRGTERRPPSDSSPEEAIAAFIVKTLPTQIREHHGELDDAFYQDIAEAVIEHARARGEATLEHFLSAKLLLEERASQEERRLLPNLTSSVLQRLFQTIEAEFKASHARRPSDPTLDEHIPIPNGSFINNAQLNTWYRLTESDLLNGGVYRSGDPGVAATLYSSYQHQFYRLESPYLEADVTAAAGAFSILPDTAFGERNIIGLMPSLNAFSGMHVPLYSGYAFRFGMEFEPRFFMGINKPEGMIFPAEMGASVGKRWSETTSFAFGARSLFDIGIRDISASSIGPNYDHALVFTAWQSNLIDGRVALELPRNERVLTGSLERSINAFGGLMTFGVSGRGSLEGNWTAYPPGMFLTLGYQAEDRHERYGMTARVALDPHIERYNNEVYRHDNKEDLYDNERTSHMLERTKDGSSVSCHPGFVPGQYTCTPDSGRGLDDEYEEQICTAEADGSLSCTQPLASGGSVSYSAVPSTDPNNYGNYLINGDSSLATIDPVVRAFYENNNLDAFVSRINGLPAYSRLAALEKMAYFLYKNSYDDRGHVTLSGRGRIDTVSPNELYSAVRSSLLGGDEIDKLTVCRGIAAFIANVGHRVGFETHAVTINPSKEAHVIVLLRGPNGSSPYVQTYHVLDAGTETMNTPALTVIEALQNVSQLRGYPPQLTFTLFDHNGNYERTLYTNEGRMLVDSITPRNRLRPFLEYAE